MMSLLLSDLLSTDLHSTESDINLGVIFFLAHERSNSQHSLVKATKNRMLTDVWTEKDTQIATRGAPGKSYVTICSLLNGL